MKKKYNIIIEETVSKTFEVVAENEKQAKEIAIKNYNVGKFVLSPGNLMQKQIQICDNTEPLTDWEEF